MLHSDIYDGTSDMHNTYTIEKPNYWQTLYSDN